MSYYKTECQFVVSQSIGWLWAFCVVLRARCGARRDCRISECGALGPVGLLLAGRPPSALALWRLQCRHDKRLQTWIIYYTQLLARGGGGGGRVERFSTRGCSENSFSTTGSRQNAAALDSECIVLSTECELVHCSRCLLIFIVFVSWLQRTKLEGNQGVCIEINIHSKVWGLQVVSWKIYDVR
jgi:hypothetical protein